MGIAVLQNLLYVWISKFEKKSTDNIKEHCDFLNESYNLNLSSPYWNLFWPLVLNGLVDHVGKGYYALTPPIIIDYTKHFIYINHVPSSIRYTQLSTGIYISSELENSRAYEIIKVNPLSALKRFPTVKDIVDTFEKSNQDLNELQYYDRKTRKGIAKLQCEGLTRYFSIPEELYMRELPGRTNNPEAFAIAYCYSRAINKVSNGEYHETNKTLALPIFALPYLLYRILLLHSLSYGEMPEISDKCFYFNNVPNTIVKQLNRILCNSIVYE